MSVSNKEKIKEIYQVLPKLNCGLCGHENCGQFARAVIAGKASPFGCRQNPWSGYKISEIAGINAIVPAGIFRSNFSCKSSGTSPAINKDKLQEEIKELSHRADNILTRIENLGISKSKGRN